MVLEVVEVVVEVVVLEVVVVVEVEVVVLVLEVVVVREGNRYNLSAMARRTNDKNFPAKPNPKLKYLK